MRTTVTLDPDTEEMLRKAVAERRTSFKKVLNDAIRSGLSAPAPSKKQAKARLLTFRSGYCGGVDRRRLQQLSDEMETDAFLGKERA